MAIDDSVLSIKDMSFVMNLHRIEERIAAACQRVGRSPRDIQVLLACKSVAAKDLKPLLESGYSLYGENTAQELIKKQSELKSQDIQWHFIGRLQTNKVKDVISRCTLIHSLDRWSLAEEIHKRAQQSINVLLEIHSSTEDTKAGIHPEELVAFVKKLENLDKICIQGVMTIADNSTDSEKVRDCFRITKKCFTLLQSLKLKNADLKYISMGMSSDYEIAVEEGANIVRLGTVVFGPRTYL